MKIYISFCWKSLLLFCFSYINLFSASYFVAVNGSDSNPGTISLPFKTITFALSKVNPGDSIIVRQGTYVLSSTISISKSGTATQNIFLVSYKNERALLDFSSMQVNSSNRGINLKGNFWYIKGIDIKGAGDNGMFISGSNNVIEFCSFFENRDTGLQLGSGASNNKIINCDSYFNADPSNGNADGFAPKLDVGTNNYFYGCRAWQNSDDGWDGYMRGGNDVSTVIENCWVFKNGYLKNGNASMGNGNGFKMGGSDDKSLMHNMTIIKSIAFDNRVKGFDQNNNRGSMYIHNCSAFRNGQNYAITLGLNSSKEAKVINCAAVDNSVALGTFVIQQTNSWLLNGEIIYNDFISLDTTGVRGKRKEDGSLPDLKFLSLSPSSKLVDAGTDIGLKFFGKAPDIGAFEFLPTKIENEISLPSEFILHQNFPNPFSVGGKSTFGGNPVTTIKYSIPTVILRQAQDDKLRQAQDDKLRQDNTTVRQAKDDTNQYVIPNKVKVSDQEIASSRQVISRNYEIKVSLKVYNTLGQEIATLVDDYQKPGEYSVDFNASKLKLASGIYFYRLQVVNPDKPGQVFTQTKKMILNK